MVTIELKNGEAVQVDLDDLKDFLDKNRDQVKIQHKPMGKRRTR